MQGTAADIIKMAMIEVDKWIGDQNSDVRMVMQVHDELVFEVKESSVSTVKQQVCGIMQSVTDLKVPLIVDAGVAENWALAH